MFNVSEVFSTIQGEGPQTGVPSVFLRFSGCNLRCEWERPDGSRSKCDTPYASWEAETKMVTEEELIKTIANMKGNITNLVLTGGEPSIVPGLVPLCKTLKEEFEFDISIETNASNPFSNPYIDFIVMSPKLTTLGNNLTPDQWASRIEMLCSMNLGAAYFLKMVAGDETSFKTCLDFFEILSDRECHLPRGIMPEGRTPEEVQESTMRILPLCIEHNIQFVDRLHIRIWGGKRGV